MRPIPKHLEQEYTNFEFVDETTMSVIWKAESKDLPRKLIIKVIKPSKNNKIHREPFDAEISTLIDLYHPSLPKIRKISPENSSDLYIVMDYIPGKNLKQVVAERGVLPEQTVLGYFKDLCRVFGYLHERGIIHKDCKPANIILYKHNTDEHLYLIDFGIAKYENEDVPVLLFTTNFASPEQKVAGAVVDERSDIYSLGATIYYLLTQAYPNQTPGLLAGTVLEPVISKCLESRPEDRYQNIGEILHDIENIENAARSQADMRDAIRRWIRVAASAAVMLVAVLIGFSGLHVLGQDVDQKIRGWLEQGHINLTHGEILLNRHNVLLMEGNLSETDENLMMANELLTKAEALLRRYIEARPTEPEGYTQLRFVLMLQGRRDESIRYINNFEEEGRLGPNIDAEYYYVWGRAFAAFENSMRHTLRARDYFMQAVELEEYVPKYRFALAQAFLSLGEYYNSIYQLEQIRGVYSAELLLAHIYYSLGQFEKALMIYEGLSFDPAQTTVFSHMQALLNGAYIARVHVQNPQRERALLEQAARFNNEPMNEVVAAHLLMNDFWTRAFGRFEQGDTHSARAVLDDALEIFPDNFMLLHLRAVNEFECVSRDPGGRNFYDFRDYAHAAINAAGDHDYAAVLHIEALLGQLSFDDEVEG